MNARPVLLSAFIIALTCCGIYVPTANSYPVDDSLKFQSELEGVEESMRLGAIGFSTTTQEQVTGAVVFLSAYVERPNGFAHSAFGTKPQRMFILRTTSGRFIVRFMELPSDLYWPGPY